MNYLINDKGEVSNYSPKKLLHGQYFSAFILGKLRWGRITLQNGNITLRYHEGQMPTISYWNTTTNLHIGTTTNLRLNDAGVTFLRVWNWLPSDGDYAYIQTTKDYEYLSIAKPDKEITGFYASKLIGGFNNLFIDATQLICKVEQIKHIRQMTKSEMENIDKHLLKVGLIFSQELKKLCPLLKIGEEHIFWDYDKSRAIIATLDQIITTTCDYPYKSNFGNFINCIRFESMEQYSKFKLCGK